MARQTQQLAGKIEIESAGLSSMSDKVEGYAMTMMEIFQTVLMPPLASSVEHLKKSEPNADDLTAATSSQEEAAIGYQKAIRALDNFVMAAIREMDKAPGKASAGIAGLPSITARTLAELQEKLDRENQISESFGIPCCRPTNFQVMTDWEQFSQSSGSGSGSAAVPRQRLLRHHPVRRRRRHRRNRSQPATPSPGEGKGKSRRTRLEPASRRAMARGKGSRLRRPVTRGARWMSPR